MAKYKLPPNLRKMKFERFNAENRTMVEKKKIINIELFQTTNFPPVKFYKTIKIWV